MTIRVCLTNAVLVVFSLPGVSYAAPPDPASSAATSLLQAAQRQADNVEARYKAGAATTEERDQAQTALALAKVQVRRQDAQRVLDRQQQGVKAGLLPASELPASALAITACDVAARQIVFDERQRSAARTNQMYRAGVVLQTDVDAAISALETARRELAQLQAKYKAARLANLKQRIVREEQKVKAGIGSRAEVQKAQAEYEAAKSL